MAHWTVDLVRAWYATTAGSSRRWITLDNQRPQVPAALLESGTTSFLRVVNVRLDRDTLFLNFATGQTGEDRADLSDAFESTGQIHLTNGDTTLLVDPSSADWERTGTNQDPYGFTPSGDALTEYRTFRDSLPDAVADVGTVTMIIWDGVGDNPFPAADTTPPTLSSAETSADGSEILLTFDENLDAASVPIASRFAVMVAGSARGISSVAIADAVATLTLDSAVRAGETVTVAYTQPPSGDVPTLEVNGASMSWSGFTNGLWGSINAINANLIQFSAAASGTRNNNLNSRYIWANGSGGTRFPAGGFVVTAGMTATYTDPSFAGLQDLVGNDVATFAAQAVTNNAPAPDTTPPAFVSAELNADRDQLTITFSEELDPAHVPGRGRWNVQINGTRRGIASNADIAITGATVVLDLPSAASEGDTVTIAYTQPGTSPNRLQDAAGNEAASFTAQPVINPDDPAPAASFPRTIDLTFNTGTSASGVTANYDGTFPADMLESNTATAFQLLITIIGSIRTLQMDVAGGNNQDLIPAYEMARFSLQSADGSQTYLTWEFADDSDDYNYLIPAGINLPPSGNARLLLERAGLDLEESIEVTDEMDRTVDYVREFTERIEASDSLDRAYTRGEEFGESIDVSDELDRTAGFDRDFSENIEASDSLAKEVGKDFGERITVSDRLETALTRGENFDETIEVSEEFGTVTNFVRNFTEQITVSDELQRTAGSVREFSEDIEVTEESEALILINDGLGGE